MKAGGVKPHVNVGQTLQRLQANKQSPAKFSKQLVDAQKTRNKTLSFNYAFENLPRVDVTG